jgi:glycosyltransferase involved in cell wall biosynthesis
MSKQKPRVLVIAEQANPDWVSVPLVGWSHSRALARLADVHLVTHIRNEENILKAGLSRTEFSVIDTTKLERVIFGAVRGVLGRASQGQTTNTALSTLPYYQFEQLVWRRFAARIFAGEFDLVHRLTPLTPAQPSTLAKKLAAAQVPFIIGPLNGGLPWPKGFGSTQRREKEWLSYVRPAFKLLPGYEATRANAAAIIAASRVTRSELPKWCHDRTVYIPENGIDPSRFDRCVQGPVTLPLKVVFVGRLVPCKCVDVLIEAAAPLVRAGLMVLDIIGDGEERPALERLVVRHGIVQGVTFCGWVKHTELQEAVTRSDVFAFPSIREFGGAVVLEAMALGLVPIVMDYGGPGELVSRACGYALPMGTRQQNVGLLRATLDAVIAHPERIRPMGQLARARAFSRFTWDAKAEQTFEVYRWVLGLREKPDFGMPLEDTPVAQKAKVERGEPVAVAARARRSEPEGIEVAAS